MRKKRIISIISAILMVILFSLSLAACTEIFKVNEEKDAEAIYLTIKYEGFEKKITKREFIQLYNINAPQLVQNGKTAEEALDEVINALTERAVKVFKSRIYVAKRLGKDKNAQYEELLTTSEQDKAIREVNSQMIKRFVEILKDEVFDKKANQGEKKYEGEKGDVTVKLEIPTDATIENQELTVAMKKGEKFTKPSDPKFKDDSTKIFLGWRNKKTGKKYDFETFVEEDLTLEAVFGLKPRIQMPKGINPDYKGDEEKYDADKDIPKEKITKKFFDLIKTNEFSYKGEDKWKFKHVDWFNELSEKDKDDFLQQAEIKLRKSLNFKGKKGQELKRYEKFLEEQYDSLLVEKRERMIYNDLKKEVTEAEMEKQFNDEYDIQKDELERLWVDTEKPAYETENKDRHDKFKSYDKDDEGTALYYGGYANADRSKLSGYVINILFKLDKEKTNELTNLRNNGVDKEIIIKKRDNYFKEMEVTISNPKYSPSEKVKDKDGKIVNTSNIIDPATDDDFKDVRDYHAEGSEYNKLVQFKKEDGKYQIVFGAKEAPNIPYLREKKPLYGANGIMEQMFNSFKAVDDVTDLSSNQKLYWKHQIAKAWLYMVGDDEGSTSSSNNHGKGYFVGGEGKGQFLKQFTSHARKLIKKGTGSYTTDGTQNGAYVFADSFSESTKEVGSGSYAGVFFLYNSQTIWDTNVKGIKKDRDGNVTDNEVAMTYDIGTAKVPREFVFNNSYDEKQTLTVNDIVFSTVAKAKFNKQKRELSEKDKEDAKGKAEMPKKIRRQIIRKSKKK